MASLNSKNRKKNSSAESIDAVVRSKLTAFDCLLLNALLFDLYWSTKSSVGGYKVEDKEIFLVHARF